MEPSKRGFPQRLAAELWRVDDLEFLGLSVRRTTGAGSLVQQRLELFLVERGLTDVVDATRTRTVLEYLSRR